MVLKGAWLACVVGLLVVAGVCCSSGDNGGASNDGSQASSGKEGGKSADEWTDAIEAAKAKGDREALDKLLERIGEAQWLRVTQEMLPNLR